MMSAQSAAASMRTYIRQSGPVAPRTPSIQRSMSGTSAVPKAVSPGRSLAPTHVSVSAILASTGW